MYLRRGRRALGKQGGKFEWFVGIIMATLAVIGFLSVYMFFFYFDAFEVNNYVARDIKQSRLDALLEVYLRFPVDGREDYRTYDLLIDSEYSGNYSKFESHTEAFFKNTYLGGNRPAWVLTHELLDLDFTIKRNVKELGSEKRRVFSSTQYLPMPLGEESRLLKVTLHEAIQ
ncbi:MAG: hypothetical protein ABIC95_01175 [archaeon]